MIKKLNPFSSDTFVFTDNGETLAQIGLKRITRAKMSIMSLTFSDTAAAKELVEYVITKFGTKGTTTFVAAVDIEPAQVLLVAGFRQCGAESLWEIKNFEPGEALEYEPFRASDAQNAAMLYNEELVIHFRPSLERSKEEFRNSGAQQYMFGKISYLAIEDNVVEFSNSKGYNLGYDGILSFACKRSGKFVKLRSYADTELEKYLTEKEFECVQERIVLVKDFYKPIKQTENPLAWLFAGWQRGVPST